MERLTGFCRRNERYLWTALVLLYIGFIYHNSLATAAESAQQSGRVLQMLRTFAGTVGMDGSRLTDHLIRKSAHFAEYSLLGLLLWNCVRSFHPTRSLWLAVEAFLSLLVPLTDETLQLFTEGRSGQVDDVWLDVAGVCFGTLFMLALWRLSRRRPRRG